MPKPSTSKRSASLMRLDRVLRRVVEPPPGNVKFAPIERDVDDPPRALRAHPGQHELAHAQEAEDVGLELPADVVERDASTAPDWL